MTSRERFEAWAKKQGHYDLSPMGGGYWSLSTSNAWHGWQAAERDMLGRAIALLTRLQSYDDEMSPGDCADELKELLNEPH